MVGITINRFGNIPKLTQSVQNEQHFVLKVTESYQSDTSGFFCLFCDFLANALGLSADKKSAANRN
jgi:hypothetical protein